MLQQPPTATAGWSRRLGKSAAARVSALPDIDAAAAQRLGYCLWNVFVGNCHSISARCPSSKRGRRTHRGA